MARKNKVPMALNDAWPEYRRLKLRNASEETIRLYHIAFRQLNRFLGRDATLADLTDRTISNFIIWRREQGVSPATVNRDLGSLLALWRWLSRRQLVQDWPNVALEPEPVRTPVAWTQSQFEALIQATLKRRGKVGEFEARDWWLALLLVCYDTGERIGAILQLTWEDVDFDANWLHFPAHNRKGKRADNTIEISQQTMAALNVLRTIHSAAGATTHRTQGLVFPWPWCRVYLWRHFGRILKAAGLPNTRLRKFHCIRRTTASHYEAAGGNATKLLMHHFRRTTEAYLDPKIVKTTPAYKLIFRPNVEPSWVPKAERPKRLRQPMQSQKPKERHHTMLWSVYENPGCSANFIASAVGEHHDTITKRLRSLADCGLIEWPYGSRGGCYVTDAGRRLCESLAEPDVPPDKHQAG